MRPPCVGVPPVVAIVMMLALHAYISSNVPMGVPIEWNVAVVYGAFAIEVGDLPVAELRARQPWEPAAA